MSYDLYFVTGACVFICVCLSDEVYKSGNHVLAHVFNILVTCCIRTMNFTADPNIIARLEEGLRDGVTLVIDCRGEPVEAILIGRIDKKDGPLAPLVIDYLIVRTTFESDKFDVLVFRRFRFVDFPPEAACKFIEGRLDLGVVLALSLLRTTCLNSLNNSFNVAWSRIIDELGMSKTFFIHERFWCIFELIVHLFLVFRFACIIVC